MNNENSNNINKEKRSKFKIIILILKILFFYIYLPGLLIYAIIKLLIRILIKLSKFIFKIFKNILLFIKNNKIKSCIIAACTLFIIATVIGILNFKKNYNKIFLTNSDFISYSDSVKVLNTKLSRIKGKISTLDGIKNTSIKVYSGNLVISKKNFESKSHWKIDVEYLSEGINIVDINVNFKDGRKKHQKFYIYNNYKGNSDGLDKKDNDGDGLINYKEIIVGTDKNKGDTDGDGLSDYQEVIKTLTNPLVVDSDNNGVNDSNSDNDNDGITNLDELKYNSNPNKKDSDGDRLSDYDEVFKYFTDANKIDTDSDGINDYDEIAMNINPNEKNSIINGVSNSTDNKVSAAINNISVKQYRSLKINDSGNVFGLKNSSSYISGPYNFSMSGKFSSATISFKFDKSTLKEGAIPTIYYINTKTNDIEPLDTSISGDTASANVTHFSNYILLDKNKIDNKIKNAPKVDGSNVSKSSISTTEYVLIAHPILNAFGHPIDLYVVDGDEKIIEKTKLAITNLVDSYNKDYEINFSYHTISKSRVKAMDFVFSAIESDTLDRLSDNETDRGIIKNILNIFFFYSHVYGGADLERVLTGEVKGEISDENAIDKKKDSNHDGISDYFTKLICNGQLTTTYGTNPFEGYTYTEIQRRGKDFDDDDLTNSEEIEIKKIDGSYFIIEHTSPIKKDSDDDGVNDKKDKSPNLGFSSDFISVSNFSYIPKTPAQDEFEKKSNDAYDTVSGNQCGTFSCSSIEVRAELTMDVAGSMHAATAMSHYLGNTGLTLDFDTDWSLIEDTYSGKDNFVNNVEKMFEIGESTVKKGDTLYFATNKELLGTDFSKDLEDVADIGWWYAVGYTNANMTAQIKNIDDNNYKMTLWYYIDDFYDWDSDQTMFNGGFGGLVSDSEMYQLHLHGRAKQYRVKIAYKMEIDWKYGDRYYLNKAFLWERPSTMKIKKLN